jgi:hypothetical protein
LASRSHTTFKKRQKEQSRIEKQLEKAAKRQERKAEKPADGVTLEIDDTLMAEETSVVEVVICPETGAILVS